MSRELRYQIGEIDTYFRTDEMSVLLFYAKALNYEDTLKLYFLTRKNIVYKIQNNMDISDLNGFDDMPAHFNIIETQLVIQFILNQLIPSLQSESVNMWEKYGGFENLKSLINNTAIDSSGLELSINYDYVPEEMDYYVDLANELKDLLQESLNLNQPMIVSSVD